MAEPTQSERLRWQTITGPMAWCDLCPFVYHGDADPDATKAIRRARKHARDTGHSTIVERGQSMRVRP